MLFCKVCSLELTSDKRTRLKLKGNAVGINDVFSELFDSLMKKYTDYPFSSFHSYLSDEPAFVCKSCFSVSITRTVSGHTHHNRRLFACTQIVENCRQKNETVYGWQRHKNVSPANKLFYSLLLLVFQALQAKCLHCCIDSGIDLLFAQCTWLCLPGLACETSS